jgi:hypothetical protein
MPPDRLPGDEQVERRFGSCRRLPKRSLSMGPSRPSPGQVKLAAYLLAASSGEAPSADPAAKRANSGTRGSAGK